MGVMDKFLKYMQLNDEDEDVYDEDYLDDEEDEIEEPAPKKASGPRVVKEQEEAYEERPARKSNVSKVTPIRQNVTRKAANGMEVCVIKPSNVEDAREITETLLANRTVVLNLEGINVDIAQRIIDFTSGSCFAIGGNLQKISHYIFIITPASVDVSGDFLDNLSGSFEMPLTGGMQ
ncbi:MAG: cell division protein SepF [Lachnospiraceae bacterium]|nr:cell division protein SepF [Lachnospiraceae bacterium]